MTLEPEYTLKEIAAACRKSTRWVRDRIKAGEDGTGPVVEYIRRGHTIHMTQAQVEQFRAQDVRGAEPVNLSITTGPSGRRSK